MNWLDTIIQFLAKFPTDNATGFITLLISLAGLFWMFFDKIGERWRDRQQTKLLQNQDLRDERRTSQDITTQQTETQLRLAEAQLNQANLLAEQARGYRESLTRIGEVLDEIECSIAEDGTYTAAGHKETIQKIRKLRREVSI